MKEASLVKYYFTKYFFLAFGLLQWLISGVLLLKQGNTLKGQYAAFLFFTLGLVLVSVFLIFSSKLRRVAISKKKVAVIGNRKAQRYDLSEIKWMKFLPVFNLYTMKIKGKKGKIYFLPCEEQEVIYGLFPSIAGMNKKMK
jgi:hypothetical protein